MWIITRTRDVKSTIGRAYVDSKLWVPLQLILTKGAKLDSFSVLANQDVLHKLNNNAQNIQIKDNGSTIDLHGIENILDSRGNNILKNFRIPFNFFHRSDSMPCPMAIQLDSQERALIQVLHKWDMLDRKWVTRCVDYACEVGNMSAELRDTVNKFCLYDKETMFLLILKARGNYINAIAHRDGKNTMCKNNNKLCTCSESHYMTVMASKFDMCTDEADIVNPASHHKTGLDFTDCDLWQSILRFILSAVWNEILVVSKAVATLRNSTDMVAFEITPGSHPLFSIPGHNRLTSKGINIISCNHSLLRSVIVSHHLVCTDMGEYRSKSIAKDGCFKLVVSFDDDALLIFPEGDHRLTQRFDTLMSFFAKASVDKCLLIALGDFIDARYPETMSFTSAHEKILWVAFEILYQTSINLRIVTDTERCQIDEKTENFTLTFGAVAAHETKWHDANKEIDEILADMENMCERFRHILIKQLESPMYAEVTDTPAKKNSVHKKKSKPRRKPKPTTTSTPRGTQPPQPPPMQTQEQDQALTGDNSSEVASGGSIGHDDDDDNCTYHDVSDSEPNEIGKKQDVCHESAPPVPLCNPIGHGRFIYTDNLIEEATMAYQLIGYT